MTLPEMLIAVGVGSLVLMSVMAIFLCSNVSFLAMGNYVSLDQSSRLAVEKMTRDIRNCQTLVSFSTNQLVFVYSGATNLTYSYDSTAGTLTYWKTGDAPTTLLTGCDSLAFSMYSNIAQPGGTLTNAVTVSQAKAISTAWKCSRTIRGTKVNSENMQEALIVIRNKPVS
jgi:hypothetical protein